MRSSTAVGWFEYPQFVNRYLPKADLLFYPQGAWLQTSEEMMVAIHLQGSDFISKLQYSLAEMFRFLHGGRQVFTDAGKVS